LLNVPHRGTATALTRSRLSTRSLLDVCHRHTATEPTGEKAKGFLLFVGPPNFNLLNWDFRP